MKTLSPGQVALEATSNARSSSPDCPIDTQPTPMHPTFPCLAALTLVLCAIPAQGIVKDIYPGTRTTSNTVVYAPPVEYGGNVLMVVDDQRHGQELWRSDGTESGTYMLKEFSSGTDSHSAGQQLVPHGGFVYLTPLIPREVSGFSYSRTLWRTDGTEAGTVPVITHINVDKILGTMGTKMFLKGNGPGTSLNQLWVLDVPTGTVDFLPIRQTGSPSPSAGIEMGGLFYFVANPADGVTSLFSTDGTAAGTHEITSGMGIGDLAPSSSRPRIPGSLRVGNRILFGHSTAAEGVELWSTDGTAAGTALVMDILPGSGSSSPEFLYSDGSMALIDADDKLWRSDGTAAGTFMISPPVGAMTPIGQHNGFFYFAQQSSLWKSDGTVAGTSLVHSGSMSGVLHDEFAITNQGMVFVAGYQSLWVTNGTAATTMPLQFSATSISDLTTTPQRAFFFGKNNAAQQFGVELHSTDGTVNGSYLVKDISWYGISSSPSRFLSYGNQCFFVADDGVHGREPWMTDGTESGTYMLRDIRPGTQGSDTAPDFVNPVEWNGRIWFTATESSAWELWSTDGTPAGTVKAPIGLTNPYNMIVHGGKMFLYAIGSGLGLEMWVTDGTLAGTTLLIDSNPGAASGGVSWQGSIQPCGAGVCFVARSPGLQLWYSDGTPGGTIALTQSSSVTLRDDSGYLGSFGSHCVFAATTAASGYEPWITDGTVAGTHIFQDLKLGVNGSDPSGFTLWQGMVCFAARGDFHSGGFGVGTGGLQNLAGDLGNWGGGGVPTPGAMFLRCRNLWQGLDLGDELGAIDLAHNQVLLADADPGIGSGLVMAWSNGPSSKKRGAVALGLTGSVAFSAHTRYVTGRELWISDGTPAGTRLLYDAAPADLDGVADIPEVGLAGQFIVFAADDSVTGMELHFARLSPISGSASATNFGTPQLATSGGAPVVGNPNFQILASGLRPLGISALLIGIGTLGQGLLLPGAPPTVRIYVNPIVASNLLFNSPAGDASYGLALPANSALVGLPLTAQFVDYDPTLPFPLPIGNSQGLQLVVGNG